MQQKWKRFLCLSSLTLALSSFASAQTGLQVVLPGTIQKALGDKEWNPAGEITRMSDLGNGLYQFVAAFPKGNYEYKVAVGGGWAENYGKDGKAGGDNIKLEVLNDATLIKFVWDSASKKVADSVNNPDIVKAPKLVILAGSIQKALGDKEWNPAGDVTRMLEVGGDLYEFIAAFPKGSFEYKVAIGGAWAENYGKDGKAGGDNIKLEVPNDKTIVRFMYDDKSHVVKDSVNFASEIKAPAAVPAQYQKVERAAGNLKEASAHWLSKGVIAVPSAWVKDGAKYSFTYSSKAGLKLGATGVTGGETLELTLDKAGLSQDLKSKFPQLADYAVLKVPETALAGLKGQMVVSVVSSEGKLLQATGVQIPGVLDDVYATNAPLGVVWKGTLPSLNLWAPTAQSVKVHLFDGPSDSEISVLPMTENKGVWTLEGKSDWNGKYYYFEVEVFAPSTLQLERNSVTDPYSLNLSMNSGRSQIVNLSDAKLKPSGWDTLKKPELISKSDLNLYELHIRDFSVMDLSVPAKQRGTYLAFTQAQSDGMKHLKTLAKSGLKAVHLLPSFDIATIEENKKLWQNPDYAKLAKMPPDGKGQQLEVSKYADLDGFNWGYDPLHYTTPEGSYAVNPDQRINEYRSMVQALNQSGLRVIQDVVYNHTNAAGQNANSILDKIVPGYYHRLSLEGNLESSTCCANTASEHTMMRKLMIDSLLVWAKDYKIDGFRFDLMGHHMLEDIKAVKTALSSLTVAKDGVDGSKIYIYGEGWNFGEVANNARGINATQGNLYGTGIGSFSDRLRDAVRGGGPFDNDHRLNQGYATGLFTLPNGLNNKGALDKVTLEHDQDLVMLGLAGNLRDYTFTNSKGETVKGSAIDYNGQPAGYAATPLETISYVAAHDNETLWDTVQMKAPRTASLEQRVRMNNLAVSIVALAQGIPFFHAGDELLRSKSLDRDSYNSGDWFNRLDLSYKTNNWGVGLPIEGKNADKWPWAAELLADPKLKASSKEIIRSRDNLAEMLNIRASSDLFRNTTLEGVQKSLSFFKTDLPGVIVMRLQGAKTPTNPYSQLIVAFNASGQPITFKNASLKGLSLHPALLSSSDSVVKTSSAADGQVMVPALTTAVFVAK